MIAFPTAPHYEICYSSKRRPSFSHDLLALASPWQTVDIPKSQTMSEFHDQGDNVKKNITN
jgi:hypothetical protein